jgi:N-methylhydantoinase A
MAEAFDALADAAVAEMEEEGNDPTAIAVRHWVDARYQGQSFELRVPREDWQNAFHGGHEERYGYSRQETPVEAVTLRAVAEAPGPEVQHSSLPTAEGAPPSASTEVFHLGGKLETTRVWRRDLLAGHTLTGPALVLEYSSTTWLPPGWLLDVDSWGSLHLMKD